MDDRVVGRMAVKGAQVRVQSLVLKMMDVERALLDLPLHSLVTRRGVDVSRTVVDAVRELEHIRESLSKEASTL